MRNFHGLSISIIFFLIVTVLSASYVFFRSQDFLKGPVLSIENTNGMTLTDSLFTVSGMAENIAFLTLNGRQIFTDEKGSFSEKLLLADGYNIISIEAKDRFGRIRTDNLSAVYIPNISLKSEFIN